MLIILLSFFLFLSRLRFWNNINLILLIIFINFIFKSGMKACNTSLNLTRWVIFHKSLGNLINILLLIKLIFIFNNHQIFYFFIQILNQHHVLVWGHFVITWDLIWHLLKVLEFFQFFYILFFSFNLQILFSLLILCFVLNIYWKMLIIIIIKIIICLGNLLIIIILLHKIILLKFDLIIFNLFLNFKFFTIWFDIFIPFKVCLVRKGFIRT